MAKYTPTEEEKRRWGITGKRKGGPGRRVHDWDLYRDIVNMPRRDSLPQEGPEQFTAPVVPGSDISHGAPMIDNRSDERKAWDKRMDALRERLEQNRKTEKDQAETYRKRWVQSRVAGLPMDEDGNPVEEPKPADEPQKESSETATTAPAQGNKLSNGQPKAGQPAADQPLARRGAPKNEPVGQGMTGRRSTRAGYGHVSWNGAAVPQSNNAAQANVAGIVAAETQAGRDRAEAAAQVQRAVSSHAPSEAYQASMNERDRIEQMGRDRRARQAAEREAAAQRRADKRFADRTLYNEADWKNLGREGSNKADYSVRKKGESDESWNAREKAIKERQGRMGSLLERLDRMADTKNEANDFYQYDPDKQKNLARLRQLIVKAGADGNDVVRDDITDAQIEGANATLDAWEKGAAKRKAEIKSFSDMKQAEQIARLRNQYGPAFSDYTPEQLLDYDKKQRESARVEILKGMQVAPWLTPETGQPAYQGRPGQDDLRPSAMAKFSQDWQKLLDTGFDPTTTFREKILGDPAKKEAYEAGLATLSKNDPDYADKADQLRRRFIVQQAMEQYGIGQEGGGEQGQVGRQIKPPVQTQPGADDSVGIDREFWGEPPAAQTTSRQRGEALAQNLPGKSILQPRLVADIENPIQPRQPRQTPGVQVFNSAADAVKARDAANAAAGIPLKRKNSNGGMLS